MRCYSCSKVSIFLLEDEFGGSEVILSATGRSTDLRNMKFTLKHFVRILVQRTEKSVDH